MSSSITEGRHKETLHTSTTYLPDNPPTSIFFKFFASRITTVNLPAVGTYRNEKQMSPSFSCFHKLCAIQLASDDLRKQFQRFDDGDGDGEALAVATITLLVYQNNSSGEKEEI